MMKLAKQTFGGDWTEEKLERVRKYLVAYATIMIRQHFRFAYIDAFAGTGYTILTESEKTSGLLFPEMAEREPQTFLEGSARIALQVQPRFTKYIFIERHQSRFAELEKLKKEFPASANDVTLVNAEANAYLKDLCENRDWSRNRAVLFLDPFGMQVTWDTIKSIATTKAIDLWILFPLGMGVNRMLKKNGHINDAWRRKLDSVFGETDWFDAFYKTKTTPSLFGLLSETEKVGNFDSIGRYFVKRLRTIFAGVAENPLPLLNSRKSPLYLLCFASGNPKGAKTAVKIAQDILKR